MNKFKVCPECGQALTADDGAVVWPRCDLGRVAGQCAMCAALLEEPRTPEERTLLLRDMAYASTVAGPASREMRPGRFW